MTTTCPCLSDDAAAAKTAIRGAEVAALIVEESHFRVAIVRCRKGWACRGCGRAFITMFGERVDWADGDDPQTWVAAPLTEEEAAALAGAGVAADEGAISRILCAERRYLYHGMPKGGAEVQEWRVGRVIVPAHD